MTSKLSALAILTLFFGALQSSAANVECTASTVSLTDTYKDLDQALVHAGPLLVYSSKLFDFMVGPDDSDFRNEWVLQIKDKATGHKIAESSGYFSADANAPLIVFGRNDQIGTATLTCYQK